MGGSGAPFLLDLYRDRVDYPDLLRKAIALANRWDADKIIIEKAGTGYPLLQELRPKFRGKVTSYRPQVDKETRFAAQTAKIETGDFVLPREAPWLDELRHELLAFPHGRHDDQVDAMAQFLDWTGRSRGRRAISRGPRQRPQGYRRRQGRRERR